MVVLDVLIVVDGGLRIDGKAGHIVVDDRIEGKLMYSELQSNKRRSAGRLVGSSVEIDQISFIAPLESSQCGCIYLLL